MAQEHVKGLLSTGEVVLIDTRQHWMALVRFALKPILLIGLVILLVLLNQTLQFTGFLEILNNLIHVVLVVAILVAVVWLPIDVVRWRSRHFVLTNRRSMRMDGVFRKRSFDSSLEQINDIGLTQSVIGRSLGYADLQLLTASDAANESYEQLMDGLQFKRAVLDAKEGIRVGQPLQMLAEGFIVKGGTNLASMRADGKLEQAAAADTAGVQAPDGAPAPVEAVTAEVLAQRSDPGSAGDTSMAAAPPPPAAAPPPPDPAPYAPPPVATAPSEQPAAPEAAAPAAPDATASGSTPWEPTPEQPAPEPPAAASPTGEVDPWGPGSPTFGTDEPTATPPAAGATDAAPTTDAFAAAEDAADREAAAWPAADTAPTTDATSPADPGGSEPKDDTPAS